MFGCTKVGPDFKKITPEVNMPKNWDNNISNDELTEWWKVFGDKTLDTLIEKGYRQNLDIKAAGLRILQARAALGISQGLYYPQIQTLSGSAFSSSVGGKNINSAGLNFDLGWEMDIWGKYARGIESAKANLYLSVASYQDIMVSVLAEIAYNYINYRISQERIIYAKRNIAIQEKVARMTEIQFNSGNVSELDMQQANTQLYSTRATLPSIELSKIKSRNALAILLGMTNKKVDEILSRKKEVSSNYLTENHDGIVQLKNDGKGPKGLSLIPQADFNPYEKLDASLLKRRPDVMAAEFKAKAASANIGKTKALLYPSFSLFGNIGYNTNDMTGSWTPAGDAVGVSIGPTFSWNIFQYGRIKNQIRVQDALFEESIVKYNKKLLQAVGEVSNALNGYTLTKKQLEENKKALQATMRAFNLSAKQYNNGLVGYQRLLSTVQTLTRTQDIYAQVKGLASINAILLYKSLGGGWQISHGKSYISDETKKDLRSRDTDWGDYLDDVKFKKVKADE